MKKKAYLLLLHSFFSIGLNAQINNLFFSEPEFDNLENFQFDFKTIEQDISFEEKINLYVDKVILKDTNSIGFYTGLNTLSDLEELRKTPKKFNEKINVYHHTKNIHVLDVNHDGLKDFIFNYIVPDETTNIQLYVNLQNGYYKNLKIPGHIISNVLYGENIQFETYGFSCCMDPNKHYYISKFENDSIIKLKHTYIPINLSTPKEISETEISFEIEKMAFEKTIDELPIIFEGKKILIQKNTKLKKYSEIKEKEKTKHLVELLISPNRKDFEINSILVWVW